MAIQWTYFKNFFAWLTGMKKEIFYQFDFSGSGHFLVTFLRYHGSKDSRSQKIHLNKKSVFSCTSTTRRNFWIPFMLWPYFHGCFWKLWQVISNSLDLFSKKFISTKNQFYHARQPREGIFELHPCCGRIFMTVFGNFDQLVLTH